MEFLFGPALEVSLKLHGGIHTEDLDDMWVVPYHLDAHDGRGIRVYNSAEGIHGTVSLKKDPSSGSSTWIEKLMIVFTQYIHYLDPFVYNDTLRIEVDLTPALGGPMSFSGYKDIPFYIDFKSICGSRFNEILETYNGIHFAIRHTMCARVTRSWYHLEIERSQPVYISKHLDDDSFTRTVLSIEIPLLDDVDAQLESNRQSYSGSMLRLEENIIDVSGELKGTVELKNLLCPVDYLQLRLLKVEFIAGIPVESIVYVHDVLGMPTESAVKGRYDDDAPFVHSCGYISRVDVDEEDTPRFTDPVVKGTVIEFHIKPSHTCHLLGKRSCFSSPEMQSIGPRFTVANESSATSNAICLGPSMDTSLLTPKLLKLQSAVQRGHVFTDDRRHLIYLKPAISISSNSEDTTSRNNPKNGAKDCVVNCAWLEYPADQHVAVRYFVRVLIVDRRSRLLWNTQEILVARKYPLQSSSYRMETDSYDIRNQHFDLGESGDSLYYSAHTV